MTAADYSEYKCEKAEAKTSAFLFATGNRRSRCDQFNGNQISRVWEIEFPSRASVGIYSILSKCSTRRILLLKKRTIQRKIFRVLLQSSKK